MVLDCAVSFNLRTRATKEQKEWQRQDKESHKQFLHQITSQRSPRTPGGLEIPFFAFLLVALAHPGRARLLLPEGQRPAPSRPVLRWRRSKAKAN